MAKINYLKLQKTMIEKQNELEEAKKQVGKILSKRMHSTAEIRKKLSKKYRIEIIDKIIEEFRRLDFLNDARFAKAYADELQNKGFGRNLIFSKLHQRGLNINDINSALPQNSSSEEIEQARIFINSKMKQIKRETDPRKRKIKFIRTLLNRGFSIETAQNLAEEILKV